MPTYEYRCDKGHEFEVVQRMSEPAVAKCIHCGAPAERLLSAGGGLLFKGSGFYITDYRSDKYKKAAAADVAPSADGKSGDSASKSSDSSSKSSDSPSSSKPADTPKGGSSPSAGSSGSE
jgi:putative FmdB family regulatory protein